MDRETRKLKIQEKAERAKLQTFADSILGAKRGPEFVPYTQEQFFWQSQAIAQLSKYERVLTPTAIFQADAGREKLIEGLCSFLEEMGRRSFYLLPKWPRLIELQVIDWSDFYRSYIEATLSLDLTLLSTDGQLLIDGSLEETTFELFIVKERDIIPQENIGERRA